MYKANNKQHATRTTRGRPSTYKKEYIEQVYKLCLLGATDKEIADVFGCAESTLNLWKKKHKDFSESIKKGKLVADAEIACSLHKRAKGYVYTETTKEPIKNPNTGEYELAVTKTVEKEVAPDTGAAMAWLKNRKPAEWRDKRETELSGDGIKVELAGDIKNWAK